MLRYTISFEREKKNIFRISWIGHVISIDKEITITYNVINYNNVGLLIETEKKIAQRKYVRLRSNFIYLLCAKHLVSYDFNNGWIPFTTNNALAMHNANHQLI